MSVRIMASSMENDTLVTMRVDPDLLPLQDRMAVLMFAFVKAVQGAVLKQVIEYDLVGGTIRFIVEGPLSPAPRGRLDITLQDWPEHVKREDTRENA